MTHLEKRGRWATALHEAAHVVVQVRSGGDFGGFISIKPEPERGILGFALDGISDSSDEKSARAQILSCYACGCSDRRLGCFHEDQCWQDEELALELLRRWGWETQESVLRAEAQVLVDRYRTEIVAVADELLVAQTLDETEVEILIAIAAGELGTSRKDLQIYRSLKTQSNR